MSTDHLRWYVSMIDPIKFSIAAKQFAGDPWKALPAAVCTAVMHSGPVMIYFGQEIGVDSVGAKGFQGDDGRTTIFDYWVTIFLLLNIDHIDHLFRVFPNFKPGTTMELVMEVN